MRQTMMYCGVLMVTLLQLACSKSNDVAQIDKTNDGSFKVYTEGNITTVQNLSADTILGISASGQPYGSGRFTFFSLANKSLVPSTDSASTKWDLALRGTTLLVNGGTSGPGSGGAYVFTGAFENLSVLPADSVFKVDNAPAYAITTGSGKGWYTYDGMNNLITPIPGRILVIRTALGKYAKIEILNYYRKGQTPATSDPDAVKLKNQRYYLFRYSYQGNGTTSF